MLSQKYKTLSDTQKLKILKEDYVLNKLSFQDIAQKYQTYSNQIRRDAIKFNIPIRDKSAAQKNALKTGKHKHPTKGQQRTQQTKDKIGHGVMDSWNNLSENELKKRQEKSRKNWLKLTDDEKENLVKSANNAARLCSKTGSKLEKFILDRLLKDGYQVDFHKEQMLSNTKLQIDLFLPTMNIAIEVDGPSHFAPIWGEDALEKNQKYDKKKNGLILGKGIFLIRIKQTRDFSKARAVQIYQQLTEILDNTPKNTKSIEIEDK